jgi:hypothetical protein
MNNRQSIDRFKSILVAAGVKSLAPKPEEGVSPTAPAAIAEAEEIKDEIKRITDDASLQVDAAVSSLSEDKRVDTENTYTDAISKVAQKVLADIVDANAGGPVLAAKLLAEITAFVDEPTEAGIPKRASAPVSQEFLEAMTVGLTDLTALFGKYPRAGYAPTNTIYAYTSGGD